MLGGGGLEGGKTFVDVGEVPFFQIWKVWGKMACFGSKKFGNFVIMIKEFCNNDQCESRKGIQKKMWEMELLVKEGKY